MRTLENNDVIYFSAKDIFIRERVVGRLENMVWTRVLFPAGSVGPISGPYDVEDLITIGFHKEDDEPDLN